MSTSAMPVIAQSTLTETPQTFARGLLKVPRQLGTQLALPLGDELEGSADKQSLVAFQLPLGAREATRPPESQLDVLQEWEGTVTEVDGDTFRARFVDLTNRDNVGFEEASFLLSDVGPNDASLVKVGGIFRWLIGYRNFNYGKRERVSNLVFRRLPAWTVSDLAKAKAFAKDLADAFHRI